MKKMKARTNLAIFALLVFAAAPAVPAYGGGTWSKTALAAHSATFVGRPGNLARFAQTTLTVTGNSSSIPLVTNGVFETVSPGDENHIFPMRTNDSAEFVFGTTARVDEVRIYSAWRDNGRVDVGVASVDVRDSEGNWTSLPNSDLAFSEGESSLGWCLVFADASGDPIANDVSGVRVAFATMDNGYVGMAEIEVIGAHLGTRTVAFCDENGNPLADVQAQIVATGTAATPPAASLVPEKPGLVLVGWDKDISCVFEDINPRPVYATHVDVHGIGQWIKTEYSSAPPLTSADKNLARMDGTTLTIERGTTNPNNPLVDGEFQTYIASYRLQSSGCIDFDFGKKVRIDGVRFFSLWQDNGRVDLAVVGLDVRVGEGDWIELDNSELPYVATDVTPGFEFVFQDPDGRALANVATALRIRFGYVENFWCGLPEIEILGALPDRGIVVIVR